MSTYSNPSWWTSEHDSAWDRVKAAFRRDWDETKHDMGGNEPDTSQNAKDTVEQASGTQEIPPRGQTVYDKVETAYRFGYGARMHYGKKYPTWNSDLEKTLQRDWEPNSGGWSVDSKHIRVGWEYEK